MNKTLVKILSNHPFSTIFRDGDKTADVDKFNFVKTVLCETDDVLSVMGYLRSIDVDFDDFYDLMRHESI